MTDRIDTDELRLASRAIHLAVEGHVADDITRLLVSAADELDRLRAVGDDHHTNPGGHQPMTTPGFAYGQLAAAFSEGVTRFIQDVTAGMADYRSGVLAAQAAQHERMVQAVEDAARRERIRAFNASDPERRLAELGRSIAFERARHGINEET